MNIIWQQPNGNIAVTAILDGGDPQEHAALLLERGDIPANWTAVSFDYHGTYPETSQEYWYWDGIGIVTNSVPTPVPQDPLTKLKEFLAVNPDVVALL